MTERKLSMSKRETVLSHPEKETRSMALPEGNACRDCRGYARCNAFIGIDPLNEVCDWYPNEFNMRLINDPRPYVLIDPAELKRLYRETYGYLKTCRSTNCGGDFEGRAFAMDALQKLIEG